MTENELLQSISGMTDSKLEPVKESMATKALLKSMVTKADLNNKVTKGDLKNMVTKEDVSMIFDKLMNTEKIIFSFDDKQKLLIDKIDVLLLKSDNMTLLLQNVNEQGAELEMDKKRKDKLEKVYHSTNPH